MPRAGIEPAIPTTFSRTGNLVRAWPRSTSTIGSSRHIWNVLQREVKVFFKEGNTTKYYYNTFSGADNGT